MHRPRRAHRPSRSHGRQRAVVHRQRAATYHVTHAATVNTCAHTYGSGDKRVGGGGIEEMRDRCVWWRLGMGVVGVC